MLKLGGALLLGLLLLLGACLPSGSPSFTGSGESGGITVEGEGKAVGERDRLEVRLYVEGQGSTAEEATGRAKGAWEVLLKRLSDLGIGAQDVASPQTNIWETGQRPTPPAASPTPSLWRAYQFVNVAVALTPRGRDLPGELAAAGASNVGNIRYLEDRVEARFSINAISSSPTEAQAEVSRKADAVRKALEDKGFKVLETNLVEAGISPDQTRPEEALRRIFVARQTTVVSTGKLDLLPQIMGAAAPTGRVDSIAYGVSNPEVLLAQAREGALVDARRKAEAIASREGVQLGRMTSVVELYSSVPAGLATTRPPEGLLTWMPPGGGPSSGQRFDAGIRLRVTYALK